MTLDIWLKIISTFFTAVIGVAAWLIAYQQLRLNKTLSSQQIRLASEQLRLSEAKLKFDLYERRLKLFEIVKEFNGGFAMSGKADTGKFYHDTIERHFLFDDDVSAYIGEVYQRALKAKRTILKLDSPNLTEADRETLNAQHVAQMQWFYDQAENAPKVFSKDLSINTLKQSGLLPVKSSYPQLSN